jgi:hypothetical protein
MTDTDAPGDQQQLSEFAADPPTRCQAISVRASRQCRHDALPGVAYCADHYHLRNDGCKAGERP